MVRGTAGISPAALRTRTSVAAIAVPGKLSPGDVHCNLLLRACSGENRAVPRGITPRRPSRSGRHEGRRSLAAAKIRPPSPARETSGRPRKKTSASSPELPANSPARIQELLRRLDQTYPGVTCALAHRNAWELLVATILSAQCTDVRVNMVTPELFRKYPSPADFAALKPEQLELEIRSTGFFRNKSKSLVGAAQKLISDFGGKVPEKMDELLTLPGVARKTANVVLGTWFGKNEGVVVDTHVQRIARRLELTREQEPRKIEQELMAIIPREKWTSFAHQLIWHGRKLCIARRPKCAECPLENLCHAADKTWSTVAIHKSAKP
jgi:endonuclease-3